ncbi:zf-HC2 domain-containing protein [Streptomyces sannanensis]
MLLGAYVLGGLSETDRRFVDSHLPGCDDCRQELTRSAPVPGLLRRAPGMLAPPPPAVPDPGAAEVSLDRLLTQVRKAETARRRRGRLQWLALAAALVMVAGLSAGLLLRPSQPEPGGPPSQFSAAAGYAVSGRATLTPKPWGTSVSVVLADLPGQGPFMLRVAAADGRSEQAATWAATPAAAATVTGASSLHLQDIQTVSVLDRAGHLLATTRLS